MLLCQTLVLAQAPAGGAIAWLTSPDEAVSVAGSSGRPVIAYITSDHCGYCRKMEQETWRHPAIVRRVSGAFVPLKIHASEHKELVRRLGVRAFPTTLVFKAGGGVEQAATGFLPPQKLAALLTPGAAGVAWIEDAGAAMAQARRVNRPILAYVTSDHCGHCRKMEQDTWADPEVAGLIQKGFVPLKIDASKNSGLAEQLGVKAFPTTIVFGADGQAQASAVGYKSPEQIATLLSPGREPLLSRAAMNPRQ